MGELRYMRASELRKDKAYEDAMGSLDKTNYMAHKPTQREQARSFISGLFNTAIENAKYNQLHSGKPAPKPVVKKVHHVQHRQAAAPKGYMLVPVANIPRVPIKRAAPKVAPKPKVNPMFAPPREWVSPYSR